VKIQETRIKIQKPSEDLQVGGILFPKDRGKLFEDEDLKTTENRRLSPEGRQNAPRAFEICLGHYPYAWGMHWGMHYAPHASVMCRACKNSGRNCLFLLRFWIKFALLAQTQVETLTINTSLPHS
jgi:hypothetical protein